MKISTFLGAIVRRGLWGSAVGDSSGFQRQEPSVNLVRNSRSLTPDAGLQISAVWACVNILSETIASLPLVVFKQDADGDKQEARDSRLARVLRQPNQMMTAHDFWVCMSLNRFLRGNAYALISRDSYGNLVSLVPLSSDQMDVAVIEGEPVYQYYKDGQMRVFAADKIFHWKGLGNGVVGLSTLEYMRATTEEMSNAQTNATELYGNGRQLTGLLTIDQDLSDSQIAQLKQRYSSLPGLTGGASDWLHVLPGDLKFQQISMSAADAQLLETRTFGIDEIGRWFGVPSALINSSGGASGTGIEQVIEAFYRSTVHPLCTAIEQALRRRVMNYRERESMTVEFKMNALQRANISTRYDSYSKALQNGFMTRNEVRKLENLPAVDGADELTAQSNLWPVRKLGEQSADQSQTPLGEPIKQ